jgi:hypothetical protein
MDVKKTSASLEMALVLPLAVVSNQLKKIETDLRLLNMKTAVFARQDEDRRDARSIEAHLERINEALVSIGGLVSDMEADLHASAKRDRERSRDD